MVGSQVYNYQHLQTGPIFVQFNFNGNEDNNQAPPPQQAPLPEPQEPEPQPIPEADYIPEPQYVPEYVPQHEQQLRISDDDISEAVAQPAETQHPQSPQIQVNNAERVAQEGQ